MLSPARRGSAVAVGVVIAIVLYPLLLDVLESPGDDSYFWYWPWLAIPVVGYLIAIIATVRRSTRSFGRGMLLGLTVLLLVGFVLLSILVQPYG
jgi:hypothetical protein